MLFLLTILFFLIGCSFLDKKISLIEKAEDIANRWDTDKFKEIYADPNNLDKINFFKNDAFGELTKICEGKIHFKILNFTYVSKDRYNAIINTYCNGDVGFRTLGEGIGNFSKVESNGGILLDENAKMVLISKKGKWLIEDFQY